MLDVSALKQFHPLIATPCYGGAVFHNYVISLVNFIRLSAELGMPVSVHMRAGDSLVTRARNDCVAEFLSKETFTHLFWIDGDIGFSPEAALRLLLADHDVAAGVYPLKRQDWPRDGIPADVTNLQDLEQLCARFTANAGDQPGPEVEVPIDDDGFIKVLDAPTGFMAIKRQVFQKLIENYPDYKYVPDWPEGTYPEGACITASSTPSSTPTPGAISPKTMPFAGCCRIWASISMRMQTRTSPIRASTCIGAASAPRSQTRPPRRSAPPRASGSRSSGSTS